MIYTSFFVFYLQAHFFFFFLTIYAAAAILILAIYLYPFLYMSAA
jgi:hypothetical protein